MDSESKASKLVGRALSRVKKAIVEDVYGNFAEARRNDAEALYNAIITVVNVQNPSIETTVYVLRQLEHTLLATENRKVVMAPAEEANEKVTKYVRPLERK